MIEAKVNFFSTNVYNDSSFAFFFLLSCIVGYLNSKSIYSVFQTGKMLVDALKHLEPWLANWSWLDSAYIHAAGRARKRSVSQLDKSFDKLVIALRGYSIRVVSVSPSLKNAYQTNHCDSINAVPDIRLFRSFLYDSRIKNLFLLNWSASSRYSKECTDDYCILSSFVLCCLWILVFLS